MLLPAKHIKLSESLIALGGFVLHYLKKPLSLQDLWLEIKKIDSTTKLSINHSYDNLLLTLSYLYSVGLIDTNDKGEIFICD